MEQGAQFKYVVAAALTLSATLSIADDSSETVTVVGRRPSSLPTQIPTTIEGITAREVAEKINATDAEDALKYFPSLLVRKRYIGDYDHAVLASRASGTGNSARSLVYADGILLSNLLGNGASFTPRWGLVTPSQIDRVDVLYGPFSAAYPGNSVGAVVDYITRMPDELEMNAKVSSFSQDFSVYGTNERYDGWQASASVGDRAGPVSWWLDFNRLDSDGHPIAFANKLVSTGVPGTAGTPVTGAVADRNPRNQDWLILGDTNQIHTVQDHVKAKVAWDVTPAFRASYTFGWWGNEADRQAESYLLDANGQPVYSGSINVDGRQYTIAATDFGLSRGDLVHMMHGLALKARASDALVIELNASLYDYAEDRVRSPLVAIPLSYSGGIGRITDLDGTGWNTLTLRGTWRSSSDEHVLDFGAQRDVYKLRTEVSNTDDWIGGSPTTRFTAFRGETTLQSLYLQDTWQFSPDWRATVGVRAERWNADDGSLSNATGTLEFGSREETFWSPKAAIACQLTESWALKASIGRAVRMPTVAELYQGSISANVIVNNDPNLKPEQSWTGELTAERELTAGYLRATFFLEDTRDALYSQTNVTVTPNVTNIQNVDHIRTSGIELAWQAQGVMTDRLDLSASLTYAHSRIVENDNFPASVDKWQPRVPDWRANAVATYRATERWSMTLGARYSGRQYNTLDNSDTNGDTYTGTSSFLVADFRTRFEFRPGLAASLGVDNLNNETYWASHPYTQRTYLAELTADF